MNPETHPMQLDLSAAEIRILTQSLENCLATCRTHVEKPDAPCEDCDAARALLKKLRSGLTSRGGAR